MNKKDSILYLKNPKVLSYTVISSSNHQAIIDLNITNQNHYDTKNEKKNKVNNKTLDFVDRKSKSKQKKKARNKIYIDKSISGIEDELEINAINSVSFVRNAKNSKNKKNSRDKILLSKSSLVEVEERTNDIYLNDLLTVQELAKKLRVSDTDIIKWLFLQGVSITINQLLDTSISTLVAEHYAFNVIKEDSKRIATFDKITKNQEGRLRAPVVTLLGHVDHGKTTLLRAINQDYSYIKEAGNITQSIGSYEIFIDNDNSMSKLIFLDTPGHEAFVSMRERGANITDVVMLVVSADDGLKPQTIEAINHIQGRDLPFIVAVNKIDKLESNISKVKQQLLEFDITDYDKYGNNIIIGVSALNGQNIDLLLSSLLSVSQTCNLKSDPNLCATGTIIEANLNKQKGPVAQLLVQNGTLHVGDIIVAGSFYGKVKAINDSKNQKVVSIESTSLVSVLCFAEVPSVGLSFQTVYDEKTAKMLVASYIDSHQSTLLNSRISLNDINKKGVTKVAKQVNFIIKTNSQGSIHAIICALSNLPQEKVQINLLFIASGEVSVKDIDLAFSSNSLILAFNLNIPSNVLKYSEKQGVAINNFDVIYDLVNYVQEYMLTFVEVKYEKRILGYAEVKNLFFVNKGVVAGCFIKQGKLKKNSHFQVHRFNECVFNGLIHSLKRIKEDVDEVLYGNECGVMCTDYNLWEVKDLIECYDLEPLEKTL